MCLGKAKLTLPRAPDQELCGSPSAVLSTDSAVSPKKSEVVPRGLISCKTGLKAPSHSVQGALKSSATNGPSMSVGTGRAEEDSWHRGTLPGRRRF